MLLLGTCVSVCSYGRGVMDVVCGNVEYGCISGAGKSYFLPVCFESAGLF